MSASRLGLSTCEPTTVILLRVRHGKPKRPKVPLAKEASPASEEFRFLFRTTVPQLADYIEEYTGKLIHQGESIESFAELWKAFSAVKAGSWGKKMREDMTYLFDKHVLPVLGQYSPWKITREFSAGVRRREGTESPKPLRQQKLASA